MQHSSTAKHSNSLFRILYAGQLDDNTVLALTLDNGLGEAQLVNTTLNYLYTAVDSVIINLQLRGIHCLQNNVGTTLQIQTLLNRISQGRDVYAETTNNRQRDNQEFPEFIPTQNYFLLKMFWI